MPIYTEKCKDKKSGKMIDKLVDGKKQYYVRTYVTNEFGNSKQVTRHNKNWLGRDGFWEAQQEENRLKNQVFKEPKENKKETINFKQLFILKCEHDDMYHNNSLSTRITYDENLRVHIFPLIGEKNIYNLSKNDMLSITKHLKEYKSKKGKNKGKHLSLKFTNEIIHTVRLILKFGCNYYDLNPNILNFLIDINEDKDIVKKIDPLTIIKQKTVLSSKDWEKVCHAMQQTIDEAPYEKKEFVKRMMIFLTTEYILMTRVGETQALNYTNLLFDYKIYVLYEAYNKRLKKITPTKNREERLLYIPDTLYQTFISLYESDSQKENFSTNQFIFGKDKIFARSTIDRYRKKLLKKAGIDYVTNHELRHAGISYAMFNNVDPSALSEMSGHDKQIMFKTYVHALKEANLDLIETLDRLPIPEI